MAITAMATITERGQVTLPKVVRETLGNTKMVEFKVTANVITLHVVPDMAGSLAKYAKHRFCRLSAGRKSPNRSIGTCYL